ncbi:baeRF3 domain-containing protein [Amycolatopsis aidingensis]|uniref:baeRF3 domain-containing protein n=1 Tax=Amycolatopsis aidingensis TaxID=2842453 RepID=UPI001C0D6514|nr:hypothetical protein [Amycolatopsis aidingensis]
MDLLSRAELDLLIRQPPAPSVSVYLPTHRSGSATGQDPIRLRNLLDSARAELLGTGLRGARIADILRPANELVANAGFWRHQSDGLALFLRAGWARWFRLPRAFAERVLVADRFHISPLLPLLTEDGRFLVLALSENQTRLLSGTRDRIHQVAVPDLPHGIAGALRFDQPGREHGFHTGERFGLRVRTIQHGQGVGAELENERLHRYLRIVDKALRGSLPSERVPLVLAGVDRIRAAYRGLTSYPHVLREGIEGSPDRLTAAELHARAWALVEPLFASRAAEAAAAFRAAEGTDLALDRQAEVLAAAESGRIAVLFLPEGADPALEPAVVGTLRTGGTVYPGAPGRSTVAALLRY